MEIHNQVSLRIESWGVHACHYHRLCACVVCRGVDLIKFISKAGKVSLGFGKVYLGFGKVYLGW